MTLHPRWRSRFRRRYRDLCGSLLGALAFSGITLGAQDPSILPDNGPSAPAGPEIIARDESGRATIRAVRLPASLRLDGDLSEDVYSTFTPISDFVQSDPAPGAAATERTQVWVLFDDAHVYVAARCWESQPDRMVLNEMRRDSQNVLQNESFSFIFDTFYDRRNSVIFHMTPLGGVRDGQATNEMQQFNADWNPVWSLAVGRFEGGWTIEAAIPFTSLSYRPGRDQVWGFNARRISRWKNELSAITPLPGGRGSGVIAMASRAATLVGLQVPEARRRLELKPWAIGHILTDRSVNPARSNDLGGDLGLDAKYGATENLTVDFTYNTDFAQVEADEQQINLTRFSLFFPEKREFFLENQGTFAFGGVRQSAGGETPTLFYSRRIGLQDGRPVPLDVGGRLTGRLNRFEIGALSMRSGDDAASEFPPATFSVVRVKRDLLRRSSIGLMFTDRTGRSAGPRHAYGIDTTLAFFDNLSVNTYWAQTPVDEAGRSDVSYRAQLDYAGDRYGVQFDRLVVGDRFDPGIGFVPRSDMHRSFGSLRFSPRVEGRGVHKVSWTGSAVRIQDGRGALETEEWEGEFALEFRNSDRLGVSYVGTHEALQEPLPLTRDISAPVGVYDFRTVRANVTLGQQRRVSGGLSAEHGRFYDGHRTALGLRQSRVTLSSQLSLEPILAINWVRLPEASFRLGLAGSRVTYTLSPTLFVSGLLQYNSGSGAVTAHGRLRWEYHPGSELFLVYNEERETHGRGLPGLVNKAVILKINRLFRP